MGKTLCFHVPWPYCFLALCWFAGYLFEAKNAKQTIMFNIEVNFHECLSGDPRKKWSCKFWNRNQRHAFLVHQFRMKTQIVLNTTSPFPGWFVLEVAHILVCVSDATCFPCIGFRLRNACIITFLTQALGLVPFDQRLGSVPSAGLIHFAQRVGLFR